MITTMIVEPVAPLGVSGERCPRCEGTLAWQQVALGLRAFVCLSCGRTWRYARRVVPVAAVAAYPDIDDEIDAEMRRDGDLCRSNACQSLPEPGKRLCAHCLGLAAERARRFRERQAAARVAA